MERDNAAVNAFCGSRHMLHARETHSVFENLFNDQSAADSLPAVSRYRSKFQRARPRAINRNLHRSSAWQSFIPSLINLLFDCDAEQGQSAISGASKETRLASMRQILAIVVSIFRNGSGGGFACLNLSNRKLPSV